MIDIEVVIRLYITSPPFSTNQSSDKNSANVISGSILFCMPPKQKNKIRPKTGTKERVNSQKLAPFLFFLPIVGQLQDKKSNKTAKIKVLSIKKEQMEFVSFKGSNDWCCVT